VAVLAESFWQPVRWGGIFRNFQTIFVCSSCTLKSEFPPSKSESFDFRGDNNLDFRGDNNLDFSQLGVCDVNPSSGFRCTERDIGWKSGRWGWRLTAEFDTLTVFQCFFRWGPSSNFPTTPRTLHVKTQTTWLRRAGSSGGSEGRRDGRGAHAEDAEDTEASGGFKHGEKPPLPGIHSHTPGSSLDELINSRWCRPCRCYFTCPGKLLRHGDDVTFSWRLPSWLAVSSLLAVSSQLPWRGR